MLKPTPTARMTPPTPAHWPPGLPQHLDGPHEGEECDILLQRDQIVHAGGDDAALELGRDVASVAVGGDDDLGGFEVASGGFHQPALVLAGDLLHAGMAADGNAAGAHTVNQPLHIERGMKLAGAFHDHAAIVEVAGHFLVQAFARQHVGAGLGAFVEAGDLLGLAVVVLGRPGADKAAGAAPEAVDAFLRDQVLDGGEGV